MKEHEFTYRKTEVLRFGFLMLICLIFMGCQDAELSAKDIIERSIDAHGGLSNWENIKQLSFDKETTLFKEDGSVELSTDQFQLFQPRPKLFGKIEWEDADSDILVMFDQGQVSKTINDSIVQDENELAKARNSFFAAQYVVHQPFALLDEGVMLSLDGIETINEKNAYAISVSYPEDTADSNKWTYYIDAETFLVVANKVVLKDHTSWVENLTYNEDTDFIFNAHRKSYRLNEAGEKTYLRAEYFYSSYSVLYQD